MGKLADSLDNASKLIAGLEKTVTSFRAKIEALREDARVWKESGFKAVNELALYVNEKLRKKSIDVSTVKDAPLKALKDANVTHYLKGIEFTREEAGKYGDQVAEAVQDEGLQRTLTAVEESLEGIAQQIRKKKKKLIQTKKFKTKIATYEETLTELQQRVGALQEAARRIRRIAPPTRQALARDLSFTEDSTIGAALAGLDSSLGNRYQWYLSLEQALDQGSKDLLAQSDFASNMKVIKEMVDSAGEMDVE